MAVNYSQLQSSYETLSENHSQLQDEVKQLEGEDILQQQQTHTYTQNLNKLNSDTSPIN